MAVASGQPGGADRRVPVILLTGFLGSGKTTLLNHWLLTPALANAAVIVNELGAIGIDHTLIASSTDNSVELITGCLCCTAGSDLVETLTNLHRLRACAEIARFDRVIVETTGLAAVAPIVQALLTPPASESYSLTRVITAVDAVLGFHTLNQHFESRHQVALADDLIVTKSDLVTSAERELMSRLQHLNPAAAIHRSSLTSPCDAQRLLDSAAFQPCATEGAGEGWLKPTAYKSIPAFPNSANAGLREQSRHGPTPSRATARGFVARHGAEIDSFCLEFSAPLRWQDVADWLDALVTDRGDDLLRVKGILDIAGRDRPVVIHAVQRLFHLPVELPSWPTAERKSQIVFITRNLSGADVRRYFAPTGGIDGSLLDSSGEGH